MNWLKVFFSDLLLTIELSKKDFHNKYLGSYLGILWAFIHPTILIFIFWFVFQIGFRSMPIDNFPFLLWLLTGIIPWFFFSDSFPSATNSIVENSFLVKKIVFKIKVLPVVKILTALKVHLFFIAVTFIMYRFYGFGFSIYDLQLLYYLFSLVFFTLAISYLSSAIMVFLKDTSQIVAMIMQFGFWITPIFWSLSMVPSNYVFIFKLNPLYYIVSGYRDTLIYRVWFWEHPVLTIYFWGVTLILFFVGTYVFKKLKIHFSDVL